MTELQVFVAMLKRARVSYSTANDGSTGSTTITVENEYDSIADMDWIFNREGQLEVVD